MIYLTNRNSFLYFGPMTKMISLRSRLMSVLFWSVVSAAFIGPGTVTTAASAGAGYGLQLVWTLVFSTLACVILQEAAARISLASGYNLGEAIALRYNGTSLDTFIRYAVSGAIILGGIAYQAGNILGAVSGLALMLDVNPKLLTLTIGLFAAVLLWWGNYNFIARFLGLLVAGMGIAFIWVAAHTDWNWGELIQASFQPSIPFGSSWLIIGLIGTTIVPYNLFLASGITKNQPISEMRWGISIAILLGGLISIAILLVGTGISGTFSFQALAEQMQTHIGSWAATLFGIGLFAAGFSSAVTAPLASAITAKSLLGNKEDESWKEKGKYHRFVWGSTLLCGLFFGLLDIKPIPAIILAQAVNGMLLPFMSILLLWMINEKSLMPKEYLNPKWLNGLMLLIVGITTFLGLTNVLKAVYRGLSIEFPSGSEPIYYLSGLSLLIVIGVGWKLWKTNS